MLAIQRFSAVSAVDASFRLYRRYFSTLFLVALITTVPPAIVGVGFQIAQARLMRLVEGAAVPGPEMVANIGPALGVWFATFFVYMITISVAGMFAMGATTIVANHAAFGRRTTAAEALRATWDRAGALFAAVLLTALVSTTGLFFFVIPGIYTYLGFLFLAPAFLLERLSVGQALRRSWSLAEGRRGRIFGATLIVGVQLAALTVGVGAINAVVGWQDVSFTIKLIEGLVGHLASAVVAPLWYVTIVLLYYGTRVEREAFDVEVLLNELARQPLTEGTVEGIP